MAMTISLPRIRRNLRIYFTLQLAQLKAGIEYRGDFWVGILGAILQQATGLIFITALFAQIPAIGDWTAWNVAILYGLVMTSKGLTELFCDGPWMLRARINTGEFDRVLVRPISPALQTATNIVSIHGFGQVILGFVVLWMGLVRSDLASGWWTLPYVALIVLCGAVMIGTINYLINMIGFWEPSAQSALPTMLSLMSDFAKFPIDVYSLVIRGFVTLVLPFAFISYFPALLVLDRETPWKWLGLATPLMTVWVIVATSWLWGKGLNKYQGVGH